MEKQKIYKIGEKKAIKAGAIEKILKENAIDSLLNEEVNFYTKETYNKLVPIITCNNKHVKISLADSEYSRNCFFEKSCVTM